MIPNKIIIHHSDSGIDTTVDQINQWHFVKGFNLSSRGFCIGYHYVILRTGDVVQTREDTELGCHSIPNEGKIGICLTGNFNTDYPNNLQLMALDILVSRLRTSYNISKVLGHRDCNRTECPGTNLYKIANLYTRISWLQFLITKILMPSPNV